MLHFLLLLFACALTIRAEFYERGKQMMLCHRMANRDVPENTLESLREARVLGCDIAEIDIWRTLDGRLVLLHDGPMDRVSTGSGEVEKTLSEEMEFYEAGSWFNGRFRGLRHPRFLDALRYAKDSGLKLQLDLKSKGITRQVYDVVRSEGMLDRVQFVGKAGDLKEVAPDFPDQRTAAWQPGMDGAKVKALQSEGRFVVASFSANEIEMNLPLMQAAAAAGVDVINTDHPRLAADALGRSIEKRALALIGRTAETDRQSRLEAISALSQFRDLPLTRVLTKLVWDEDATVSRAAAVALARSSNPGALSKLIRESEGRTQPIHSWANIAWLARFSPQVGQDTNTWLVKQAVSSDPKTAEESLRALAIHTPPGSALVARQQLRHSNALVRGAAALALARTDKACAPQLIAAAGLLQREIYGHWSSYAEPASKSSASARSRTTFERPEATSPKATAQIARAHELYGGYHSILRALGSLETPEADTWLHEQVLRVAPDFSGFASYVAAMQLWDRAQPAVLVKGFEMNDPMRRDRAQWTLLKRGPVSSESLRALLDSKDTDARLRAAQTLGWLGDSAAREKLSGLAHSDIGNRTVYEWSLGKISEIESIR